MKIFKAIKDAVVNAVTWPSRYANRHPSGNQIKRFESVTRAAVTPGGQIQIVVSKSEKILDTFLPEGINSRREAECCVIGMNLEKDRVRDITRKHIRVAVRSHREAEAEERRAKRQAEIADVTTKPVPATEVAQTTPSSMETRPAQVVSGPAIEDCLLPVAGTA